MAFKLTYSDGAETDYDDNTKWEVEAGVLKMGRESGKWTVLVSPSHWATLEMVQAQEGDKEKGEDEEKGEDKDKDEGKDKDEDKDKEEDEDKDS